jgi:hypothetical protein
VTDLPDLETLLGELNQAAKGVAAASTKLGELTKAMENEVSEDGEVTLGVGARYQIELDTALVAIYEETEKPPPADIRLAKANTRLRQTHPDLVAEHARLTTEAKALQQWISANKQVISARQSIVNGLRGIGA